MGTSTTVLVLAVKAVVVVGRLPCSKHQLLLFVD